MTGRSHIFLSNHFCWSTRPVRGETARCRPSSKMQRISIHSPRSGRDIDSMHFRSRPENFNPLAPCGARPAANTAHKLYRAFQSTRPVRGETSNGYANMPDIIISIHSPRAGRDASSSRTASPRKNFNPLAPCGARPKLAAHFAYNRLYFNPLAPCGARQVRALSLIRLILFQSTRPVRGETPIDYTVRQNQAISIHSPRAGRDAVICN